jgi:hypothetical protein
VTENATKTNTTESHTPFPTTESPSRFTDEFWSRAFRVAHRILVTADDFLCAEFDFSRRPRGKWIKRQDGA